jgi:phage-related protein
VSVSERRVGFVVDSIQKTITEFPPLVVAEVAQALYLAQRGDKADSAKPLKGFHGARVLEIVSDDDGNTYRVIYTTIARDAIWVLHAFQKKSTSGIATPQREIELVRNRLKRIPEP